MAKPDDEISVDDNFEIRASRNGDGVLAEAEPLAAEASGWGSLAELTGTVKFDNPGSISDGALLGAARARGLTAFAADSWVTDQGSAELPAGTRVLFEFSMGRGSARICERGATVFRLAAPTERGPVRCEVAALDVSSAKSAIGDIRALLPRAPRSAVRDERCHVWFDFVWATNNGIATDSNLLDVSAWDEVASNYPAVARQQLSRLMRNQPDGSSGKTIVLHGPAGTGKTSAVRALAWEWREHTSFTVVPDPDRLFGGDTGYLMELIVDPKKRYSRRRLLVLEDAGELLTRDARTLVGQGLSRFLNVCDGLVGQQRNVALLVTTNEPIGTIHPAVRRPGRCLAEIELPAMTMRQANNWLRRQGSDHRVTRSQTLAELYALIGGRAPEGSSAEQAPVGFGAVLG